MKRIFACTVVLTLLFALCACSGREQNRPAPVLTPSGASEEPVPSDDPNPDDGSFKGIVIGFSGVDLPVPPYEKDGIVYADLAGFAEYFRGTVSFGGDGTVAVVNISSASAKYHVITFEAGKLTVSATNLTDGTTETVSLTAAPQKTESGFDIAAADFVTLLGYKYTMQGGVMRVDVA